MSSFDAINAIEPRYQAMTDAELREQTVKFRKRLAAGETLEDLLFEAFAAAREASKRTIWLGHAEATPDYHPEIQDLDDMRVVEEALGPRLALEPPGDLAGACPSGEERLQRERPSRRDVLDLVDRADAALADARAHPVATRDN